MLGDPLERASALCDAGDYVAALEEVDRLLAREPGHARAHVTRAWALENLGPERLVDARDAYLEAVRRDPTELWAKEGLANVLRRLDRRDEADDLCVEIVDEARSRPERDADLLELLGWCEYRLGRLDEAVDAFREALALDADLVAVRLDLGLTLLAAARPEEALAEYGEAVRRAARIGETRGLVAVALDDLDETLAERPDLRETSEALAARGLLLRAVEAPHGPASSGAGTEPMGGTWSALASDS